MNPTLCHQLSNSSAKSGSSILPTYNALFPDTCLPILKSLRDKESASAKASEIPVVKDSQGNALAITIMYMVDDDDDDDDDKEHDEQTIKLPPDQFILAEKASNFVLRSGHSSNVTLMESDDGQGMTTLVQWESPEVETSRIEEDVSVITLPQPGPVLSSPASTTAQTVDTTTSTLDRPLFTDDDDRHDDSSTKLIAAVMKNPEVDDSCSKNHQSIDDSCSSSVLPGMQSFLSLTSIHSAPPPPCPSRQVNGQEEDFSRLVVNPVVTQEDEGTNPSPRLPRINKSDITHIETQCSMSTLSDVTTTNVSENEHFIQVGGPPMCTNYGDGGKEEERSIFAPQVARSGPLIPLLPPIHAALGGLNCPVVKPSLESPSRSGTNIVPATTNDSHTKVVIECETVTKRSISNKSSPRLVTYASPPPLPPQPEGSLPFFTDAQQAHAVQEAISRLCLEIGPPVPLRTNNNGSRSGTSVNKLPLLPLTRDAYIALPLAGLRSNRRHHHHLPPLPPSPMTRAPPVCTTPVPSLTSSISLLLPTPPKRPPARHRGASKSKSPKGTRYGEPPPTTTTQQILNRRNFIADNIASAFRTPGK